LPWERVDKNYVFESAGGRQTLADLFAASSQLIIYHFMFDPDWDAGCPHCSFWADRFNPNVVHLKARDVSLVAVAQSTCSTRLTTISTSCRRVATRAVDHSLGVRRRDEYDA
jgi:predicted dithiol-disulfide oxidoreductase (DUF899 family)